MAGCVQVRMGAAPLSKYRVPHTYLADTRTAAEIIADCLARWREDRDFLNAHACEHGFDTREARLQRMRSWLERFPAVWGEARFIRQRRHEYHAALGLPPPRRIPPPPFEPMPPIPNAPVKKRRGPPTGRYRSPTLTAAKIDEIRRAPGTHQQIAALFNLSRTTVYRIKGRAQVA